MARRNKAKTPSAPQSSQIVQQTTAYQGPIPKPDDLMRYDQITPGLADRIMVMAEKESGHRQLQEQTLLDVNAKLANRQQTEVILGQVFGLIIGLAAMGTSAWLAVNGYPVAGGLLGTAGIVGLVTAFIWGRQDKK